MTARSSIASATTFFAPGPFAAGTEVTEFGTDLVIESVLEADRHRPSIAVRVTATGILRRATTGGFP